MAIIRCKDITGIECEVAFDADEEFAISQMIGHAKGSHGLSISEDQIRDYWEKPSDPKVEIKVKPEIEVVDLSDLKHKELVKLAKDKGVYRKRMKKAGLIKALS